MIKIGVITVARSDYGILRPVLQAISAHPEMELQLYVTGTHLEESHGSTISEIKEDGIPITAQVPLTYDDDSPGVIAETMARTTLGFSWVYEEHEPDLIVVLGDRYEMFAAATAAIPFTIPLVHIHGGEETEGAIDNVFRHALTKMSHLHFTSTDEYASRIKQMGEEDWRVTVSGAPALDNLSTLAILGLEELEQRTGLDFSVPTLLVTFHPVTLEDKNASEDITELLTALANAEQQVLFTMPNADAGNLALRSAITDFTEKHPSAKAVDHLGTEGYFSTMHHAVAMVGNSSSGIIEAASFTLPVINIGSRQQGRIAGANVVNCPCRTKDIQQAIGQVLQPEFKDGISRLVNPYGSGVAAETILGVLSSTEINNALLQKRFIKRTTPTQAGGIAADAPACVLFGAGGHAQVLIDAIQAESRVKLIGILDQDVQLIGQEVLGVPVLGSDAALDQLINQHKVTHFALGIGSVGDSSVRKTVFEKAVKAGLKPVTVIHPDAVVSPHASLGEGTMVLAQAVVNPGAITGQNVIINTRSVVEHHSSIGDHSHLSPGAIVCGHVSTGPRTHIGAGAIVREGISLGQGSIIGAGAVVINNVPDQTTVVGCPAQPVSKDKE